jgi:hypothetical protein
MPQYPQDQPQGNFVVGNPRSVDYTLGTANTVTSITNIPSTARGFRIIAASADLRVAVNQAPPASNSTGSGTTFNIGTSGQYNLVKTGVVYLATFDTTTPYLTIPTSIQINSNTASATFTLEIF